MDLINNYALENGELKTDEPSEKDRDQLDQGIKNLIAGGLNKEYSQHMFNWDELSFKKEFNIASETKPPYYIDIKNAEQIYKAIFYSVNNFINSQLTLRQKHLIDGGVKKLAWHADKKTLNAKYISEISFFPEQKIGGSIEVYVYNTILDKEYKFDTINFFTGFYIHS